MKVLRSCVSDKFTREIQASTMKKGNQQSVQVTVLSGFAHTTSRKTE